MRGWLGLGALMLAVAALGAWIYFRPPPQDALTFALSELKAAEVKRVQLERGDPASPDDQSGVLAVFERRDDAWRMSAPFSARVDAFQMERLLAILDVRASARFPRGDLARFGLDKPSARLTLNEQVFAYGAINTVTREQYVHTGDWVYAIPVSQRTSLPRDADAMVSRALFDSGESPVRFVLPGFSVSLDEGRWKVEPDPGELSADERNAWVDAWRNASALRAASAQPKPTASSVKVTLKDGRELTFGIVQREPELVLLREDEGVEYSILGEAGKRLLAPPARKD
jgi:hypothetical protein